MSVCQTQHRISKYNQTVAARIMKKIGNYKDDLLQSGQKSVSDINKLKNKTKEEIHNASDKVKNSYFHMPWRKKRPDITLLAEILLLIVIGIILYTVWPYLTGSTKPGFNKAQFLKATKIPETAFNIEELAKVRLKRRLLIEQEDE